MRRFTVKQCDTQPGKIDVVCQDTAQQGRVWTLSPAEFASLVEEIHAQYVPAITEAWQRENQRGH